MLGLYIIALACLLGYNFLLSLLDNLVLFYFRKGLETSFTLGLFASTIIGLCIY
jgi:hypothetical protein